MSTEAPVVTEPVIPAEPTAPVVVEKTPPAEELGETGLKALQSEREARKAAELKLKEFEDRDKTEAQKQQEALEKAREELAALTTAKTRAEVAATKSVPTDLLAGPASGSAEDLATFADALIKFRGEKGSNGLHVRTEGRSPTVQVDDEKEAVKTLFGGGD